MLRSGIAHAYDGIGLQNDPAHWMGFLQDVKQCHWHTEQAHQMAGNTHRWQDGPKPLDPNKLTMKPFQASFCTYTADEYTWKITRLGPFNSSGGIDWHGIHFHDLFQSSMYRQLYIDQMLSFPIDLDMHPISYPPLHNHHSQVRETGELHPHYILLNHQDSTCDISLGGMLCNMVTFPNGTSLVSRSSIDIDALFQDVRPAHAQMMNFSLLVAIRIRNEPPIRSVVLWRVDPHPTITDAAQRGAFLTFSIPAGVASVTWSSSVVPVSGRVLLMWHHSHTARGHVESWYMDADPVSLGLRSSCGIQSVPGGRVHANAQENLTRYIVGGTGSALTCDDLHTTDYCMETFKSAVEAKIRGNGSLVRCKAYRTNATTVETGDRQMRWLCSEDATMFASGQVITVLMFWDGRGLSAPIWQHHHYQAYVQVEGVHAFYADTTAIYACPALPSKLKAEVNTRSRSLKLPTLHSLTPPGSSRLTSGQDR